MLILSATDENDSTVFKREYVGNLNNREIYADKIYSDIPNRYSKSDEGQIYIWTSSTYHGKDCHRIDYSNF